MRQLIVILLFLIVSVWFGLTAMQHPGYILLVYQPWLIQIPLWFVVIGLIITFGLFYILVDSVDQIGFFFYRVKNWFRFRREHKFYSKTQDGLTAFIESEWKRAEKNLMAGANESAEPLVNYLAAAKAANELKAYERADHHLKQAYHSVPDAKLAIGLTQAELYIQREKLDDAVKVLKRLKQEAPKHARVLKLLEKVYIKQSSWYALHALLPDLRKAKMITTEQQVQFEKHIYCEILNESHSFSLDALHQQWEAIPRAVRKNPEVVLAYVTRLREFTTTSDEIAELIRKTLKYDWQPELVRIYADLPFDNLNKQLVIGGGWLKIHGEKPELLFMLGKICSRVQLWGKARDYFDRCLMQGADPEAGLSYGQLLEKLDKPEEANQVYREVLAKLGSHKANRKAE